MSIELRDYQIKAIAQLKNGSILCGDVGSGKSRTALGYYYLQICEGGIRITGIGWKKNMKNPTDLYIITTAKKRDSLDWEHECENYYIYKDKNKSISKVGLVVDSWNNIEKYSKVRNAFFIFDEQRVVGSGPWVKAFLSISKNNQWILLSATPGDNWKDYIPIFIANGFYRSRSEFYDNHCVFSRQTKYLKIDKYINENILIKLRDSITVYMKDERHTIRHNILVNVDYDRILYKKVLKERWDPFDDEPIDDAGKLIYILRKIVNSDKSRIVETIKIINKQKKCIIFYNFNYELEMLKNMCESISITYSEWNGKRHQELPTGNKWIYLAQYNAASEGWNCTTTDTVIFFSQNYSYRITEQSSGRIDRMNTEYVDLYYYHLKSVAPIDLAIYRALSQKKNFNENSYIKKKKY